MNTGFLSVGIPVYNQVDTIAETIESLLKQDRLVAEIVVSENHSTDGTREVVERYRGRVRIVRPPVHFVMAANWNFTVNQLRTQWFSLLSGDDLALPGYVRILESAATTPGAVMVRAPYVEVSSGGSVLGLQKLRMAPRVTDYPANLEEQLLGPRVGFAAFAASIDGWRKAGGFPEKLHCYADWAFWLRLARFGRFVLCREPAAKYRIHANAVLSRERALLELQDELEIATRIIPAATQDSLRSAHVSQARRWRLQYYLATHPASGDLFRDEIACNAVENWAYEVDGSVLLDVWRNGGVRHPVIPLGRRARGAWHFLRKQFED
jgi:glycosyltransferase involved in cell wall biosynthesis